MVGQVPLALVDRQTLLGHRLLRHIQVGVRARPLGLKPLRPLDAGPGQVEQLTLLFEGGQVPGVAQYLALDQGRQFRHRGLCLLEGRQEVPIVQAHQQLARRHALAIAHRHLRHPTRARGHDLEQVRILHLTVQHQLRGQVPQPRRFDLDPPHPLLADGHRLLRARRPKVSKDTNRQCQDKEGKNKLEGLVYAHVATATSASGPGGHCPAREG